MTDFEKGVYSDMSAADRILILTIKLLEVIELCSLMTKLGDGPVVKKAIDFAKQQKGE